MANEENVWKVEDRARILNESALGFDTVTLTGHAQDQMEIRGVTVEDVLKTIRNPTERGLPTQPGRQRFRWHKTIRTAIDVVHMPIENSLFVVTVIKITRRIVERRRR